MHDFDATQENAGATKFLEPEHRAGPALDRAVVLLDEVIDPARKY
ncbi:hypothetical protein QFZ98_004459 [Paraburkholderia youngii]